MATAIVEVLGDGRPEQPAGTPCRGCGAVMIWFKTAKNKRPIPIDEGFVVLSTRDVDGVGTVARLQGTPHFITCPQRDQFKRKPDPFRRGARS